MHTWWWSTNHEHIWFLRYVNLVFAWRDMAAFLFITNVDFAVYIHVWRIQWFGLLAFNHDAMVWFITLTSLQIKISQFELTTSPCLSSANENRNKPMAFLYTWIWSWIKLVSNELDITFHVLASQLWRRVVHLWRHQHWIVVSPVERKPNEWYTGSMCEHRRFHHNLRTFMSCKK